MSDSLSNAEALSLSDEAPGPGFIAQLFPVMAVVVTIFMVTGLSVPVVPLHVHQGLGLGEFAVGLVVGVQFGVALISRPWAGHYADKHGARRGIAVGLLVASVSGILYLASLPYVHIPYLSVTILLLGRTLLGAAESFLITGAMTLGLGIVESGNDGRVIAWVGMAMFIALGLGAPIGTQLYEFGGFSAVGWATLLAPLATFSVISRLPEVMGHSENRSTFFEVARKVWMPGLGAALSSIGFGAILAFGALLFATHEWHHVWLPFTTYVIGLIASRALLGHLPDRIGGAKVALVCVFIEATGLLLIWLASEPMVAAAGAFLTGIGYSLVYPGLGAEALERVPGHSRGLAMGIYTAFLDFALGFGSPALGLVAGWAGLGSVFLAGSGIVLGAAVITSIILTMRATRAEGYYNDIT